MSRELFTSSTEAAKPRPSEGSFIRGVRDVAEEKGLECWVICDLLGHKRLAGRVTEEEHFGSKMGRIDVPTEDGSFVTVFFGGSSVYSLTPVTEEVARAAARHTQPAPVSIWQLPAPKPADYAAVPNDHDRDDDEDDSDDDLPY